jgi:hypothetical protein
MIGANLLYLAAVYADLIVQDQVNRWVLAQSQDAQEAQAAEQQPAQSSQ